MDYLLKVLSFIFDFLMRILSNVNEKCGGCHAYVKFCDGKYHWCRIEEKLIYDAAGRIIQEQNCAILPFGQRVYKYVYEGHVVKGFFSDFPNRRRITVYSENYTNEIYRGQFCDDKLEWESWPKENEMKVSEYDFFSDIQYERDEKK